jgi:hypothetical protein
MSFRCASVSPPTGRLGVSHLISSPLISYPHSDASEEQGCSCAVPGTALLLSSLDPVPPVPAQVVNDYERDVFNGDQGFVVGVLPDGALDVEFPPAQPSTGGASYGKQPSAGNPADAPGATLANVAPTQSAQAGAAAGQAPPMAEAPTPPQPRRLQYLGRQVTLNILFAFVWQL